MMVNEFFRPRKEKTLFICQITESNLKVIKCLISNFKREFVGLGVEKLSSDIDDKTLAEKINQVLKKLEYKNNPIIISLLRQLATCRYLRIPSQLPEEIERIANLQSARYLPYPADELIAAYQLIQTDREGYSHINLSIAHRDVIGRYLNLFKESRPVKINIVLSSYGLCNLYSFIKPEEQSSVMVIDINSNQVELIVTSLGKLLFSRSFKLVRNQLNWENLFIDEMNKTQDAYFKEVSKQAISEVVVLGTKEISQTCAQILNKHTTLPAGPISYTEKIKISKDVLNNILSSDSSFASIIGLGLEVMPESLSLLPVGLKEKTKKISQKKERSRIILFLASIIVIWILGVAKNLDNKQNYLERLNIELNKIAKEAKSLEEIDRRFEFMESRLQKKPSTLDIIYELHQIVPSQISLVNFIYDEDNQVVLRGQTPELNSVFAFVSSLEKSPIFKNFNVKVRYATQKKTQLGEIVDFEIVCAKR